MMRVKMLGMAKRLLRWLGPIIDDARARDKRRAVTIARFAARPRRIFAGRRV